MKQYDKYKDSGVKWLGEIPEHWKINKISRAFHCIGSGTTPSTNDTRFYSNKDVNWLITGDLNDGIITETSKKISQAAFDEFSALRLYPKYSVVIAMYGATIGKLGFLDIETTTNQACCVINNSDVISQKFLFYYLLSNKKHIISLSYGGGQPNISQDTIKHLNIIQPSISEQNTIASYLDYVIGKIDEIIWTKEQLLIKLQEKRKALINQVVMRGLDPNAPMKDSGIEWLGEIPAHWKIVLLKRCVDINNGKDYKNIVSESGYPVIGSGGQFAYCKEYLYDGEVLFLGRKGTIDKPQYFNGKFWAVDTMFYAIPRANTICKYMFYQALNFPFDLYSTATALPSMTQTDLGNHIVCLPPLSEQSAIVSHIEQKTEKIDKLVSETTLQLEKLKEYKTSIISEAVTGKVDLREWKPKKI